MFIRKYWLPLSVFLIVIVMVGLYVLQTRPEKAPIKIYKAVEVETPKAEVPVGETSQGGHFHADGTWHEGQHEPPAKSPDAASSERTYEMVEVDGEMLPVPHRDDPTISQGLREMFDIPYFNKPETLAFYWKEEKEGYHIETKEEIWQKIQQEKQEMEAKGYYEYRDKWYKLPTDGSHWSSNHLPENPEEYYADDPEALQLWHAVTVILKYKQSGAFDDPNFVPEEHPDYVEAATVRGKHLERSIGGYYTRERRRELRAITNRLVDKP